GLPRGAEVVRESGGPGVLGGAVRYRIDVFGRTGRPGRSGEGPDLVPQISRAGLPSRGIQHGRALRGRNGRAARSGTGGGMVSQSGGSGYFAGAGGVKERSR